MRRSYGKAAQRAAPSIPIPYASKIFDDDEEATNSSVTTSSSSIKGAQKNHHAAATSGISRELIDHLGYLVDNALTALGSSTTNLDAIHSISLLCLSSSERTNLKDCGGLSLIKKLLIKPSDDMAKLGAVAEIIFLLSNDAKCRSEFERDEGVLRFCGEACLKLVSAAAPEAAESPKSSNVTATTADPTTSGRKRKRKKRGGDAGAPTPSSQMIPDRSSSSLNKAIRKYAAYPNPTPLTLLLLMLRRIVIGGEDPDEFTSSTNVTHTSNFNSHSTSVEIDIAPTSEAEDTVTPVLKALERSSCLSSLASTLIILMNQHSNPHNPNPNPNPQLSVQLKMAISICDGSCCLAPKNRHLLCFENDGSLISSIVKFITSSSSEPEQGQGDVQLIACQLVTSLTHENPMACSQLCENDCENGLTKLFACLVENVKFRGGGILGENLNEKKFAFDSCVYILNALTNCAEIDGKAVGAKLEGGDGGLVTWLVEFVHKELEKIADMIQNGTQRDDIGMEEEDMLVIGANGVVLLTTLLQGDYDLFEKRILGEGEGVRLGAEFMWKTLKCFVTLMEFRCGLLSLGLADPVLKLIEYLKSLGEKGENE
ncbi:hypothetical protein ScalyP_jg10544 [Parmales sp. scaly parma]|nr:hypothetical protein ScalyP_jg10544 [Parmales sp. scaly parma]